MQLFIFDLSCYARAAGDMNLIWSMDCQLSVPVDKWQFNNNGLHIVNTRTKDFAHGHTMGNGQI